MYFWLFLHCDGYFCTFLVFLMTGNVAVWRRRWQPCISRCISSCISNCISGCIFIHFSYFSWRALRCGGGRWQPWGEPRFNLSWTIHLLQATLPSYPLYLFVYFCMHTCISTCIYTDISWAFHLLQSTSSCYQFNLLRKEIIQHRDKKLFLDLIIEDE